MKRSTVAVLVVGAVVACIVSTFIPSALRPWLLIGVPLAFIVAPIGLYAAVVASLIGGNYVAEILVKMRMKASKRWVKPARILSKAGSTGGTILIESPTVGWNVTRAWWTHEDVLARAPCKPSASPMEIAECMPRPFDVWCYHEYTDLGEGKAVLFGVWNGAKIARKLSAAMAPTPNVIKVWTGPVITGFFG